MKKLVSLFLVIGFVAFLFGCSNENSWYMIEDSPEQKIGVIDEHGQLPAPIRFDSGAKLETTEDNTLVKNVVVNLTETKSYDTGRNPIGTPEYIYIYDITAKQVDSLGASTEVSSLEKPFKLTLPANHLGTEGICYAGIREDKSSPWKYTRLSEDGITTLSQRSIRASGSGIVLPIYELSLYRIGIEIALFVYNKPPEEARKDITCAGIAATATTPLLSLDDNGNYLSDLDIDIKLIGDNLSCLKDSDITVSIIYRSRKNTPEEIKINNLTPQKTETKSDAAVSGENNYVHKLVLNYSNFNATFGGEASINFTLGLKGKSSSDFPTDFMVEVSSVDNLENLIPFTYSNNVSYKAEKSATVYEITYDLDGGCLAEGDTNPVKYTTASESFTLKNPIKEGYTFAGWTGTGLSSATMVVTIEKGSSGDREYRATWNQNAPDTYTLTVMKGTGIATVSGGGSYETGMKIALEYTLEDGYEFASWTSADVAVTDNKFTMPAKDVTVTANASIIVYRIRYEGIGGADVVTNPVTYDVTSATITLNNPTKAGYTFKGWSGDGLEGNENLTVTITKGSTGDKTYTANWSLASYTITYNDIKDATFADGDNPVTYNVESEDIKLNNPNKDGYTFKGWSGTDLTGDENLTVTITQGSTGNKTYTAIWTPISYSITYDLNGGSFAEAITNPKSYDITSATITLINPTRENYNFLGWTGTGIASDTASMTVTIPNGSMGSRYYVASWTETPSIITLDPQGGNLSAISWVVDNRIIYTSASGSFKLPIPLKRNYDFVGWIYGENAPVKDVEISTTENRTYVASWTALKDVLTFNLPGDVTLEMRRCPNGSFIRSGSFGDGNTVTITNDFYMGTYQITNAQYVAIMGSPSPSSVEGSDFTGDSKPVVYVSWDDIMAPDGFIDRMNSQFSSQLPSGYKFALPTEAQWEYACRAGTTTDYNNGKDMVEPMDEDPGLTEVAWYMCNAVGITHNVGVGVSPNSFGLYDMHGNVWEWCADWYGSYDATNTTDPTGPDTGTERVTRGGSFDDFPDSCTSWTRNRFTPDFQFFSYGFRLAIVPVQN